MILGKKSALPEPGQSANNADGNSGAETQVKQSSV